MHLGLTWTDFEMTDGNKLWCNGISCFILIKKKGDVCRGAEVPIFSLSFTIFFRCKYFQKQFVTLVINKKCTHKFQKLEFMHNLV